MSVSRKSRMTIFLVIILALALAGVLLLVRSMKKNPRRPDTPAGEFASFSSDMITNAPPSPATTTDHPTPLLTKEGIKGRLKEEVAVSLADIKACMTKPVQQSGPCYDGLFRAFLKTHTTADALKIVAAYEDTDAQLRYACHPVVHAIGRETFAKLRTVHDSFAACDQTCHSGCYHGAMERFIRGDQANDTEKHIGDEEIIAKTTTACPADQPSRFRFQCLHGLGHALLFSLDYQLEKTLATCDKLPTAWDRSSCWGGAFMENLFPSDPTKSDVKTADYHYPCDKLGEQYKSDCYVMQTTRMTTMGLDTAGLFTECRKAGDYALSCIQSIGRDLSNDARISSGGGSVSGGKVTATAQKCELGQADAERQACTRGVIYALMDNTWDGRYAFPFCKAFANEADRVYCMSASARYLHATYDKTKETILDDCVSRISNEIACSDAVKGF